MTGSAAGFSPFTMDMRLCDDEGNVSERPIADWPGAERPVPSYLDRLNRLRAMTHHGPVAKPFACTGSAHLAGEHIRCTSPAHVLTEIAPGVWSV